MQPVVPDHGGACIDGIVPAVLGRRPGAPLPAWVPASVADARQVVLLVLDGLGWEQLQERAHLAPTLAAMTGGPITSVAPTTTATALTSITTGKPPAVHGVVGYRVHVGDGAVMNVLRWETDAGDARDAVPPELFQHEVSFGGRGVTAVIRAEFLSTGFTAACLRDARLRGWRVPSTLVVQVSELLRAGEPFVYAYYDGVDRVAHQFGMGEYYDAELRAVDRLVADLGDTRKWHGEEDRAILLRELEFRLADEECSLLLVRHVLMTGDVLNIRVHLLGCRFADSCVGQCNKQETADSNHRRRRTHVALYAIVG